MHILICGKCTRKYTRYGKTIDIIKRIGSLKWQWVENLARHTEHWSGYTRCRSWAERRNVCIPQQRLYNEIKCVEGLNWCQAAQNKSKRSNIKVAYIQLIENYFITEKSTPSTEVGPDVCNFIWLIANIWDIRELLLLIFGGYLSDSLDSLMHFKVFIVAGYCEEQRQRRLQVYESSLIAEYILYIVCYPTVRL